MSDTRHTTFGTPCSPAWDDAWVHAVESKEQELNHRICGARTVAGTPCTLESNHQNGRCRFHGGFDLTGAQKNNRNAVIHGLYLRGLRPCGPVCPAWGSCPLAGKDVQDTAPAERPVCPYEKVQFDSAVTDLQAFVETGPQNNPYLNRLVRQTALLEVMMMRATRAMAERNLVDDPAPENAEPVDAGATEPGSSRRSGARPPQARLNVYLQAFMKLSPEHRRYLALIEKHARPEPGADGVSTSRINEHTRRAALDTSLLPEEQAVLHTTEPPVEAHAQQLLAYGTWYLRQHDYQEAVDCYNTAALLSPDTAASRYDEFKRASDAISRSGLYGVRPIVPRSWVESRPLDVPAEPAAVG